MQFYFADLEQDITSLGTKTVIYATLVLVVTTIIAILTNNKTDKLKLPLFLIMAITLIGSTLLLFGSTVYLNVKSESGGPVHWHSDIEFWACGAELNLKDPTGKLSNKIGSATYHEHDDKRIHLEGVVVKKSEDASMEKFMRVTGGFITNDAVGIPLNDDESTWYADGDKLDGDRQNLDHKDQLRNYVKKTDTGNILQLVNGYMCGDHPAELQTFVYSYDKTTKTYSQQKLDNGAEYILRDESVVPPGDCVIVEFDKPKNQTNKLCKQYGVRDTARCVEFGVTEHNPGLCNINEVGGHE